MKRVCDSQKIGESPLSSQHSKVRRKRVNLESVKSGRMCLFVEGAGADLGGGCRGCAPLPEMTYGFLIQLVFCKKMWFIGVSYAIS